MQALTALAAFALLAIASLAALAWSSPQRGSADSVPFREDIWPPGTLRGTGASEQRRESSSLWASTTSQQQQKQVILHSAYQPNQPLCVYKSRTELASVLQGLQPDLPH